MLSMMLVTAIALSLCTISTFAEGRAQNQTQTQLQTQDLLQTQDQLRNQEQDRLQIRERLQITDSAITQQRFRLQTMDQSRIQFPDCENHWAQNQVASGWAFGLINGYSDGNFGPERNVSGIEGVLFTARLMNGLAGINAGTVTPGSIDWTGVPDWARVQLQEQNALRLMNQTNYYQDANMNRLQVAVMLAKGLGLVPIPVTEQTQLRFMDQARISTEELGYILALENLGIVTGYPDHTFQPDRTVTRAEICTILVRVLELLN